MQNNNMRLLFILLLINILCCRRGDTQIVKYDQFLNQKIESRDSIYVLYTVREWGKRDLYSWGVRSDMYKITSDEIKYFIGGVFYSPDKKRILVWVGIEEPNAGTLEKYSDKPGINKICPYGKDTVYSASSLIGMRDNIDSTWTLYPFDQQQAVCCSDKKSAINILSQYYFREMKSHQMFRMIQSGKRKGYKELQAYGYNLQDTDFWNKCWLFQKDTVGSNGLYTFQIKGYNYMGNKCTQKSAEPYNIPIVNYPEEILRLYH